MQSKYKFVFFSTILLIPIILLGQAKKISSIELSEFTSRTDYLVDFVVKNNQFYIGTPYVLYTLGINGEITDSLMPRNKYNLTASDYRFDVLDKKLSKDKSIFYFFGFLTDIVVYENKQRLISIEGVPHIFFKDSCFDNAHTIFDGNKQFYSLYVSEKAAQDGKYYPVIAKLDTITGIDMDDMVFNEKKINFKLTLNEETTFRIDDSLFVFANNITSYKNQIVFTDSTLSAKRIIDVQKALDIPILDKSLTKIISLDSGNCLFVVSLLDKKKDIIGSVNYKNGRVIKLLTVSKPKPTYVLYRNKKVEFSVFTRFKQAVYPNQILYAHNQDKIYALYYENDNFILDVYKLN